MLNLDESALDSSRLCQTNYIISFLHLPGRRKATTHLVALICLAFRRTMLEAIVLVREDSEVLDRTHAKEKRNVRNDAKLTARTHAMYH